MLKLGWMSTGRGLGSFNLLRVVCENIEAGTLDVRLSCVVCNRQQGEAEQSDRFLDFVRSKGIPLVSHSSSAFRRSFAGEDWRTEFDRLLSRQIDQFEVELFFLAGYMLIVSEFFCTRYVLLNLHPALPDGPKGEWPDVMQVLARTSAPATGAMIHIVTPELDRGPVASYFSFALSGEPFEGFRRRGDYGGLAAAIREHELRREFPLILTTLRALAAGDIIISGQRVLDHSGRLLEGGRDLSPEIERLSLAREI